MVRTFGEIKHFLRVRSDQNLGGGLIISIINAWMVILAG
jgi:hypothetical protein